MYRRVLVVTVLVPHKDLAVKHLVVSEDVVEHLFI